MPRMSRWSAEDRAVLLKMVREGHAEQHIRDCFSYYDKFGIHNTMSAMSFAQQLKQAMVEAGEIKQKTGKNKENCESIYKVTSTGRLTVHDFQSRTGAQANQEFSMLPPRGRSKAWRIVPRGLVEE